MKPDIKPKPRPSPRREVAVFMRDLLRHYSTKEIVRMAAVACIVVDQDGTVQISVRAKRGKRTVLIGAVERLKFQLLCEEEGLL